MLKHYGKISFFEQATMTAEDRNWYIERLKEEDKKQREQNSAPQSGKGFGGSEIK